MKINIIILILLLIVNAGLFANDCDFQTLLGKTLVSKVENGLEIKSFDDNVIINWDKFNINENEIINFVQPHDYSCVLNRIIGQTKTTILGSLLSNGKVFLINPNGIIIGKNAQIDVDSFFASTLDLKEVDFNFDNEMFLESHLDTSIINLGKINAKNDVYLISKTIKNKSQIESSCGDINLIASTKVLIKPEGNNNIFILSEDKEIPKEEVGINNSGLLKGVKIKLISNGNIYANAIKHTGKIESNGIKNINGEVYLVAKDGLIQTKKNAQLIAKNENSTGGQVNILADEIRLEGNTLIDVSSKLGEGEVNIGGGYQGKDQRFFNSQMTSVSENVKINSDAIINGNGGKVILWSDGWTSFLGDISSRGGSENGDGGFIEVSGLKNLIYRGRVNTKALNGKTGTLLLDPSDITISAAATSNGAFDGGSPTDTFTPTAATANILNTDLTLALDAANVVIDTTSTSLSSGDISFTALYTYTSAGTAGGSLTLNADNDININSALILTFDVSSLANLNFNAGNDILIDADLNVDNANNITMIAGNDFTISTTNTFDCDNVSSIQLTAGATFTIANSGTGTPGNIDFSLSDNLGITANDITILGQIDNSFIGDLSLTATNDINIGPSTNDSSGANVQSRVSTNTGTISVVAGNDLILTGGTTDDEQFAQIGRKATNVNCDIHLTVGRDLKLIAGGAGLENDCFALIGHGGSGGFSDSSMIGDIIIHNIGRNCILDSTNGFNDCFTQIGHSAMNDSNNLTFSGDIRGPSAGSYVPIQGDLDIFAGNENQTYAIIGHGGSNISGGGTLTLSGDILVQANNIEIEGGDSQDTAAAVGFQVRMSAGTPSAIINNSNVKLKALDNLLVKAGTGASGGGGPGLIGALINTTDVTRTSAFIDIDLIDIKCLGRTTLLGGRTNPNENIILLGAMTADLDSVLITTLGTSRSNLNIDIEGNFSAISRNGETIFIQNGTTTTAGKTLNIKTGQDFFMMAESKGVQVNAIDTAVLDIAQDLSLLSDTEPCIIDAQNTLNITVGRDVDVIGHCDGSSFTRATIQNRAGNLSIKAGRDITLGPWGEIANLGSGEIAVVVDNDFPNKWDIGSGSFFMNVHTEVGRSGGGIVRIFTASRSQNFITNQFGTSTFVNGAINNNVFTQGPLFVNSAIEQWATYFSSSFGGEPFTIFYKDFPFPSILSLFGQDPTFLYPDYELFYKPFYIYLYYDPLIRLPKQRKVPWNQLNEKIDLYKSQL
ncbi:MAG: Heme/hemopexin-binding protein [Candidatus Anoxychlamydiales bacterium]|nr:Heme/hemopexin-binding protein [Candidatus Anoxychlamydiales bacterium]